VDVFRACTGSRQTVDPWLVAHVEAWIGRALFVVSDASVYQYGVMLGAHKPAMNTGLDFVFYRVVKMRHQPIFLRLPHLGTEVRKHKSADEPRAGVVLDSGHFDRSQFQALPPTINVVHVLQHTGLSDLMAT